MKITGMMLLLIGMAGGALAVSVAVPELDASSATTGVALLSGALLVISSRRKNRKK